jgi:glycosyltransferase involved in cell wall biosynthesis
MVGAVPPEVDVILPCLNEAEALGWVLGRIPPGVRPIVVDNGSTDGSADIARDHGAQVVCVPQRGYGAACHAGYGCSFLIATPIYVWYALPFVVLVIMAGRLEWLAVWAALYVAFVFDRETFVQALAFGIALVIVVLVGLRRWGKARHQSLEGELPLPVGRNIGNYPPAGAAPRSSGVGREQQARLE